MADTQDRVLTVEQAARLIYGTAAPTEMQLGKVREKLRKGMLRAGPRGPWSTTTGAVAEYLAARNAPRSLGRTDLVATSSAGETNLPRRHPAPISRVRRSEALQHLYGDLLRDYFLAVILRGRAKRHTRGFHAAVVAGQVLLLVGSLWLISTIALSARAVIAPERLAVTQWLDKTQTHGYSIEEWFAPIESEDGASVTVRVKYRYYTKGRKGISTDREFTIENGVVSQARQVE